MWDSHSWLSVEARAKAQGDSQEWLFPQDRYACAASAAPSGSAFPVHSVKC